jgi:Kef-type K+ transport system membrane component KefB
MLMLLAHGATSGPVFEFLVLFSVILLGPIVLERLGLPGLIGFVLGGFVIGAHGLGLIHAGNQTVPELGHLGLLYLMFVAGLELDLHVLREYRRAAVLLGLLAFAIPGAAGIGVGWILGWSFPAMCLLGALVASHTLIVYPTLRDAGLGDNRAVASAVGATVLTDTLALIVLAVVAGSQTDSGSPAYILGEIAVGFAVLIGAGLFLLPRLVDVAFRVWGGDRVARYLVVIVALLGMALIAQVFGIEGIVGAFFAGLALNRLVPNEGPSMEQVEFFGTAVFVPVFLVSIGLLLDPSVMFTGEALRLAALICAAALGGKAIACWLAGARLGFNRPERGAMFVLTAPQAAATLAVTLIGFEIGLFGTTVVNAVLVLILVSIVLSALLTDKVIDWMPARAWATPRLGARVLVVTSSTGPSEAAVRAATLITRPDGGHSDLLITRGADELSPEPARLRAVERRISRFGFEGRVRAEVGQIEHAVSKAIRGGEHSLVIADDPAVTTQAGGVPLLVVDGIGPNPTAELRVADADESVTVAELGERLDERGNRFLRSLGRSRSGAATRLILRDAAVPPAPVARDQADVVAVAEPSSEA